MDLRREKHAERTPCPFCDGTGSLHKVRVDGPLKIRTYVCRSCLKSWDGSERWADQVAGGFTEPQMVRNQE